MIYNIQNNHIQDPKLRIFVNELQELCKKHNVVLEGYFTISSAKLLKDMTTGLFNTISSLNLSVWGSKTDFFKFLYHGEKSKVMRWVSSGKVATTHFISDVDGAVFVVNNDGTIIKTVTEMPKQLPEKIIEPLLSSDR